MLSTEWRKKRSRGWLKVLPERNMDGAAGYPPWSAPHESRSPPTANLRSGRFVRAQARWVAAKVPWNEGSAEALMVQIYCPRPGFDGKLSRTENLFPEEIGARHQALL